MADYSWSDYYKTSYEKAKRENMLLAGKVADAEGKRTELAEKYGRICSNPLYRVSRAVTKPVKLAVKAPGKLRKIAHEASWKRKKVDNNVSVDTEYFSEIINQKNPYHAWTMNEPLPRPEYGRNEPESVITLPYKAILDIEKMKQDIGSEVEYILFAEDTENLDEFARKEIFYLQELHSYARIIYGAEDSAEYVRGAEEESCRFAPWFKPAWSPDTLLSYFYFGSYFAIEKAFLFETLDKLIDLELTKQLLQNKDESGLIYYLCLEATADLRHQTTWASVVQVVDSVLYHSQVVVDEARGCEVKPGLEYFLDSSETVLGEHKEFWGYEEKYTSIKQDILKRHYGVDSKVSETPVAPFTVVLPDISEVEKACPVVSVVIPSKDHPELVKKCIGSFLEKTDLGTKTAREMVEFIVVDNGSCDEKRQEIAAYLNQISEDCCDTAYLYGESDFNFSAMCNAGAAKALGEFILLLNDDVEIIEKSWLLRMLGRAMLPQTGAVGAKLWYPSGEKIQHVGITNMHIGPSHKLVTFPDDRVYYYGQNILPVNMIGVTAACLLVRKTIYDEVGGLDEAMKVSYNDVDFCFKIYEKGYHNVNANDAVLVHHESLSRGLDDLSDEKWRRLLSEKRKLYEKHPGLDQKDPYYSEQLADDAPGYGIGYKFPWQNPLTVQKGQLVKGKSALEAHLHSGVMLTVERAGLQRKIHEHWPEIICIEGWCYMLNEDNMGYERSVVLEALDEDGCVLIPVANRYRPDVEAVIAGQKNIALAGFVARIPLEDIPKGNYVTGILYKDVSTGRKFYQRSDKTISVQ